MHILLTMFLMSVLPTVMVVTGYLCFFYELDWLYLLIILGVWVLSVVINITCSDTKEKGLGIYYASVGGGIGWVWILCMPATLWFLVSAIFLEGSWWEFVYSFVVGFFAKATAREFQNSSAEWNIKNQSIKDDFKNAEDAFEQEDYETAYKLYLSLADQGYAEAQSSLGFMYSTGEGVPQDDKEAVKWYRLSAEQGDYKAQGCLGSMYREGKGVPQDYVLAHMWVNLSTSKGSPFAIGLRENLEKKMTKQQIEKAQEMARNWKPKK